MIRRRSYTEAVGGDAVEPHYPVIEAVPNEYNTMAGYLSSSSDEYVGETKRKVKSYVRKSVENELNKIVKKPEDDGCIRSDSIKYYDMRHSKSFDISDGDAASTHSVKEIYNACLEYVSDASSQGRKSAMPDDFSSLRNYLANSRHCSVELNQTNTTDAIQMSISDNDQMVARKPEQDVSIPRVHVDYCDDIEYDDDYDDENKENQPGNRKSFIPLLYIGRNSAKKKRQKPESFGRRAKRPKRVVFKNGDTNIPLRNNIMGKAGLFMKDFVTTMIEWRWRWLVFFFSASNFFVWVIFALMFYVAAMANGDLSGGENTGTPCIENGRTFTGIYTFSVETQVSIGYGEKYPTEKCPEVIFIMLMEVVVGYLLIGVMVCIVFAKIIRPEKQMEGVGFSKNAVVCMRDGKLCFVFRAWDCEQKHSIGAQAKGWFVKHRIAASPLILPLSLGNSPLLLWPTTLQHVIDEKSPLFDISAKDLLDRKFEIIITLTGGAKLTGQMTQSRTSYMSHEIRWGSRFKNIITYNPKAEAYTIDAKSVNEFESADIPLCSARLLRELNNAFLPDPTCMSISLPASPFLSPIASPNWSFRSRVLNNDCNKSLP